MKKILLILLFIILNALSFLPKNVKAENLIYMRVLSEDVYIYQDASFTNKLFKIPYGYFVLIDQDYGDYCKVTYGEQNDKFPVIIGFIKKENLTNFSNTPKKPYCTFNVTNNISDILFNDIEKQIPYFNVAKNSILTYYGEITLTNGETLVYCYFNSKLGYIDKKSLTPYTIPASLDEIESEETSNITNNNSVEKPNNKTNPETIQIVIIVGISIISISVVYFLFKPSKVKDVTTNHNYDFYEEGE